MKPSPLPALLPLLLLPPLAPAPRAPARGPGSVPAACGSFPAHPTGRPGSESSWIRAYIPMRNCHRVLRDRRGQFSPPAYRGNSPINFWCNWTIWAGSRQHILVYIQGFTTQEDCSKNEDKILFEGVSSLVEDSAVFACWRKETHVFATFAEAVHVVLLKTYLPRCRDTRFRGSYYIFRPEEGGLSAGEDLAAETPAPARPKPDPVLQSGLVQVLGDALSPASTAVPWMPVSPHGAGLRDRDAPGELGAVQGTGDPVGASPTAAPGTRGLSRSMSGGVDWGRTHGFSNMFSGTLALGALREEEPLPRTVRTGLESRQAFLHPALGAPGLDVKPTRTGDVDLVAPSRDLSPGGGESGEEGPGPAVRPELGTVGLENTECPLLSSVADGAASGLAGSLMPSLTVQTDVVSGDDSLLLPARSFPEPSSVAEPVLRTSVLPYATLTSFPAPGSFGDDPEVEKLLHPAGSWGVPEGQPQPSTRSGCSLRVAPTEPGSAGPRGGDLPLVSLGRGRAPSGASPTPTMGMTLVPARPEADPACAELGDAHVTLAASLLVEVPVEPGALEPLGVLTTDTNAEGLPVPPAQELGALAKGTERPVPSAPCGSAGACPQQGGDFAGPGVRKLVLDGDGAGSGSRAEAAAPAARADGDSFASARDLQQQLPDPHPGVGHPPAEDPVAPSLPPVPVALPPGPWSPGGGGQHHNRAELGAPWALEYFPVRSCHVVLRAAFGLFSPPLRSDAKPNIWCNWTIWAGPQKHILVYIQGFHTSDGCGTNQDKVIFQGVLSSVETQVVHACYNRGTVVFAARAAAVQVVLLSGSRYERFEGRYYVFRDHAALGSSETPAPEWEVSETDIPVRVTQPHALKEGARGGEFRLLEDETELGRSLGGGQAEGRGHGQEELVEPAAARADAGQSTKLPALHIVEGDARPEPWVPAAPSGTTRVPLEAAGSSGILPDPAPTRSSRWVGAAAAAGPFATRMGAMEEPPLQTDVKPSPLHPSLGMTAGGTAVPGDGQEDLFDLASLVASLENDTALRSQHRPGDVLFEVTVEIEHVDWAPRGGRELNKDLLESMKSHIQKNLKLSANRVNEIKLKDIRRAGGGNLLLTWWLHLRPDETSLALALRSELRALLREPAGAARPVSLLVEDVDECGLGLCGQAADCFNGVGTYLCRCKEGYEDRSPSKSGTLCVPAPRSGLRSLFQQPEVLLAAAASAGLVLLVAVLALRRAARRHSGANPFLEEPAAPEEPGAEVVMELSRLRDCLRLEPFQLKVRARPPDWISRAPRAFVRQEERL